MAIEDGVVLARRLGAMVAGPAPALRAYEQERMARTAMITNASWWIGKIAQWSTPTALMIRRHLSIVAFDA